MIFSKIRPQEHNIQHNLADNQTQSPIRSILVISRISFTCWSDVCNNNIQKQVKCTNFAAICATERTIIRSVSYRNRYWAYHIESATYFRRPILRATLQVQQLLTAGGGGGAGVRMLTATLQPLFRPTCHIPALQPTHQTTE